MCLSPRIGFTWERMTYSSPESEIERGLFRTGSTNGYKGRKKRKRVNRSFTVRRQRETWRSVNIYTARKEGTSFSPFFFFPLFLLSFFFFHRSVFTTFPKIVVDFRSLRRLASLTRTRPEILEIGLGSRTITFYPRCVLCMVSPAAHFTCYGNFHATSRVGHNFERFVVEKLSFTRDTSKYAASVFEKPRSNSWQSGHWLHRACNVIVTRRSNLHVHFNVDLFQVISASSQTLRNKFLLFFLFSTVWKHMFKEQRRWKYLETPRLANIFANEVLRARAPSEERRTSFKGDCLFAKSRGFAGVAYLCAFCKEYFWLYSIMLKYTAELEEKMAAEKLKNSRKYLYLWAGKWRSVWEMFCFSYIILKRIH